MPLLVIILFFFLEEVCNSSIFLTLHVEVMAAKCLITSTPVTEAEKPLISTTDISLYFLGHIPRQLKRSREISSFELAGVCCSWIYWSQTFPAAMPSVAAVCLMNWQRFFLQLESMGETGQVTRWFRWAQHKSGSLESLQSTFFFCMAFNTVWMCFLLQSIQQKLLHILEGPLFYHFVKEGTRYWYDFSL